MKTASPTAEALAPKATPGQTLPSSRTRRASFSAQGGLEAALATVVMAFLPRTAGRELRRRAAGAERREAEEEEVEAADDADAEEADAAATLLLALLAATGLGATAAADTPLSVLRACMAFRFPSLADRERERGREHENTGKKLEKDVSKRRIERSFFAAVLLHKKKKKNSLETKKEIENSTVFWLFSVSESARRGFSWAPSLSQKPCRTRCVCSRAR